MRAVRSAATSRTLISLQSLLLLGVFTAPAYAQIETVVVTAERRAVDLQKIPVAVSAFTAKDRDRIGINSIQDMASFTPGMTYSTATDRVTLRGVSRQTNVLSADSGVANYSDGIYQSFAVEAGRSSLDLDRVEIVRGPQSTLYGRNSIGGAINQITPRPTDEFTAEFRTSYENYDHSTVEGAVSGPIDDNWKYRLYADWDRQGLGWAKNTIGGPEQGGAIDEWYIEGQLQGNIAPNVETWTRVYSTHWDNFSGGPGANANGWTPADYPTYETGQGELTINPAYGCTAFNSQAKTPTANPTYPNAFGNTTATAASEFNANSPNGSPCQNPAVGSPWRTQQITPYGDKVPGAYFGVTQWTWHTGDNFDVKYIGGAEWYRYVLTGSQGYQQAQEAPITSLTIGTSGNPLTGFSPGVVPLSAIGQAAAGACFNAVTNPSGICPALTFNPQSTFNYQQQEFFTQNEINLVSTGDDPLQWQAGLYSFIQHESQPVSVSQPGFGGTGFDPTNAFDNPITANPACNPEPGAGCGTPGEPAAALPAAPEGPFNLAHSNVGHRWFDDRIQFNDISLAAYGQASYALTDELKITAGARYSKDRKYGVEESRLVLFPLDPEFFGAFSPAVDITPPGSTSNSDVPAKNVPDVVDYFSGNSGPCQATVATPNGGGHEQAVSPTPDIGVTQCAQYNPATGFAVRRYNHASDAVTGSIKAEYTPDDTTELYASYARGYKGGGYNTGIFSFINPKPWVGPEHIDAVEVGSKKTFANIVGENTSLVLDLAAYYYSYEDLQVPLAVAAGAGGVNSIEFLSIPHSVSEGFEAEAWFTPIEHLLGVLSYSYDEAHITSSLVNGLDGTPQGVSDPVDPNALVPGAKPLFSTTDCFNTRNNPKPDCGTDIYTAGTNPDPHCAPQASCGWVIPQSLKGNRLPNAPLNKIAVNLSYEWQIPEWGTFTPSVTWRWQGSQFGTVFSRFYNMAPSWDQYDARISFTSPDSHWTFIIYGKNLGNAIGYDQGATSSRYAGTIDRACNGTPLVAGGVLSGFPAAIAAQSPCNFVQGETAGATSAATPPGYGAVRGESAYGTVSTYSITPPAIYGAQLQFKF